MSKLKKEMMETFPPAYILILKCLQDHKEKSNPVYHADYEKLIQTLKDLYLMPDEIRETFYLSIQEAMEDESNNQVKKSGETIMEILSITKPKN